MEISSNPIFKHLNPVVIFSKPALVKPNLKYLPRVAQGSVDIKLGSSSLKASSSLLDVQQGVRFAVHLLKNWNRSVEFVNLSGPLTCLDLLNTGTAE